MKKEKDEDLDKLFKNGLETPVNEPVYREVDWESMEQTLDKGKKRPVIVFLLPLLGTAAALILVLLGWLYFRPKASVESGSQDGTQVATVKQYAKNTTGTSGGAIRNESADSSKHKTLNSANYAQNPVHHGGQKKTDRSLPYSPVGSAAVLPAKSSKGANSQSFTANSRKKADQVSSGDRNSLSNLTNNIAPNKKNVNTADAKNQTIVEGNAVASNVTNATGQDKKELGTLDAQKQPLSANNNVATAIIADDKEKKEASPVIDGQKQPDAAKNVAANTVKPKVKTVNATKGLNRAIFAVTAIATTDLNGVSSLQGSRIGGNIGGLVSMNISKWTFTTGMMYSIKPYQEDFANYHTNYPFKTNPASIGVNCRMIDIPLNVNYQVFGNRSNKITLGTGLSSYIILREDYKFNYANATTNSYSPGSPYGPGPAGYSVINKNRNIFGILNLDATYDHQINSKLGISLQPYVKLPFSNVGASQVKLQSAGVAVGFNWYLNSFKKPD